MLRTKARAASALTLALVPLLATTGSLTPRAQAEEARPPNVVIIVTDDQRVGTMDVMPSTRRWFGRRGQKFTNTFVTTPFCCPSRSSIFTGRYAHNHGVRRGTSLEVSALDQSTTLPRYLHDAGYRTAIFGKYLNNWDLTQDPPHFDKWAIIQRAHAWGYAGGTWNVNGRLDTIERYTTSYLRDQATKFVRRAESSDRQPWFLYLAPTAPHAPYKAERKYRRTAVPLFPGNPAVHDDTSDKPSFVQNKDRGLSWGQWVAMRQRRTLLSVDDMVNALMQQLRDSGELDNTLAIFMSDNGFLWGEHGLSLKFYPYTESIQVPMFMRWPGRVDTGTVDDRLAANIDVFPTVMDAVGLTASHPVDGISLLQPWERDRLLTEYWPLPNVDWLPPPWASIRTKDHQYIEYYDGDGDVRDREYYDLTVDRWQLDNLFGDSDRTNDPDLGSLSALLGADRACSGTLCP